MSIIKGMEIQFLFKASEKLYLTKILYREEEWQAETKLFTIFVMRISNEATYSYSKQTPNRSFSLYIFWICGPCSEKE